jgi:hypothetical protein
MAVTISRYNQTAKLLLNKEITLTTLKVMLLDSNASFTAADTTLATVSNSAAYEVDGNGWTTGGETLASVAVTTVSTDGAMLDAADVTVTATGGSIGPADAAVIYDDSMTSPADAVLWYIDFGGSETAGVGTDFKITFNASGIARVTSA